MAGMSSFRPMRIAPIVATILSLAACGGAKSDPAASENAAAPVEAKIDPKAAAAEAKAKELAAALSLQKPAFDAALGANDEAGISELADSGNGWALHHRAEARLSSQDYSQQQGGFEDMEAAAALGIADAQMWVGMKMAYGLDGYQLKPSSGLMMMERAARQGNVEAILAVGLMYEQDTFMKDKARAREWYARAAALGSEEARQALEKLATPDES
jgi:TPR repeat protein